jgi:hypothetical protein
MHYGKMLVVLAAVVLFPACGVHPDQEYVDSMPGLADVGMEIKGGSDEGFTGASAQQGLEAAELEQMTQEIGSVPEYLRHARAGIKELNEHVKRILDPILTIIRNNGGQAERGQSRTWTKEVDGLTYRLTIKKISAVQYAWKVDAKATSAEDSAYKNVMGGGITRNRAAERGRGFLGIDLDNLKLVDPNFQGQGKLLCGYSRSQGSKTVAYFLRNFTPNISNREPITASFVGHRIAENGLTGVRMVAQVNIEGAGETPTDAKELVRLRVRFLPGLGGRGDLYATGGDIAQGVWYYGVACWSASEEETFKALLRCSRSGTGRTCTPVRTEGERSTCAPRLGGADDVENQPAESLTDSSPVLEGAPDLFSAPEGVPSGEVAPEE